MNRKYVISINALLAITGPSCWGAAQNLIQQLDNAATRGDTAQAKQVAQQAMQMSELSPELIAYSAQFLDPQSFVHAASVNQVVRQMPLYRLLTKHKGNLQKALFDVAQNGTPDITGSADITTINFLIRNGVKVDGKDAFGRTALILAATNGHVPAVTQLLQSGANVNATGKDDRTALMWAIDNKYDKIIDQLLQAETDINYFNYINDRDFKGDTALLLAIKNKNEAIASKIIKKSADIGVEIENGPNALNTAILKKLPTIVHELIQAGVSTRRLTDYQKKQLRQWGIGVY